jgi:PAS domain-containing protein
MEEPKENPLFSRKNFYLLLLFFFVLPYFLVVGLTLNQLAVTVGKTLIVRALLGLSTTITASYFLFRAYEKMMQEKVSLLVKQKVESIGAQSVMAHEKEISRLKGVVEDATRNHEHQIDLLQSSTAKSKERVEELELELEKKHEEIRLSYREYEDLRIEYERLDEEMKRLKAEDQDALKHREGLLSEYQQTIHEQRAIIEKKQRYIAKLEEKVRDQMYEIRSLLQLEDVERSPIQEFPEQKEELSQYYLPNPQLVQPQAHTTYDLSLLLQKYINTAEQFTTLSYKEGKGPRFQESYALDFRRLFESLRDETAGILFVYSPHEGKLLFVNQHVKTLLGWTPEKLIKDFPGLLVNGKEGWKEALNSVLHQKQMTFSLAFASKHGESVPFQCFMGRIPSGPFTHHVVGLLAPKK